MMNSTLPVNVNVKNGTSNPENRKISPIPIPVSYDGMIPITLKSNSTESLDEVEHVLESPSLSPPATGSGFLHLSQSDASLKAACKGRNSPNVLPPRFIRNQMPASSLEVEGLGFTPNLAKHVQTEQFMPKHAFKAKLSKYQGYLDRAFSLIQVGAEDAVIEGATITFKVMAKSWLVPRIGHDLAYGLCDYLRETGHLEYLIQIFSHDATADSVRIAVGKALEECMSSRNRHFIAVAGFLKTVIGTAHQFSNRLLAKLEDKVDQLAQEALRLSVSLMECMFKHSAETSLILIETYALDHVLTVVKMTANSQILRHAALALANLAMYSDNECQQKMMMKKVQDWLFLLASVQDEITRYYACLAICMLVSNKEIENAVIKSGTLSLVEPFLLSHKPDQFAAADVKHSQGRPKEWLERLVPMLHAKRHEAKGLAAFHFAMEAGIKKQQENTQVFQDIGAISALKQIASSPDEVPAKFATIALKIIGEEIPYKLSQQVPLWSVDDVQYWVSKIGFSQYADKFQEQMVDGDLLLLLSNEELENDIGMTSGLHRKRFRRELDSLKISADYSCVDETQLDRLLMSVNPQLSVYTYHLLELGFDTSLLHALNEDLLCNVLHVINPVHRLRILQASKDYALADDMELEILRKHIDIFISYRRSTGNQLASLIKVLLQLRGHKVFIDIDRLYAGAFDSSLLKNIKAADHFVLVLTPHSLDRCLGDETCEDWVHKEVRCAIENQRNIIPIFDPEFEWPDEMRMPPDIHALMRHNGVRWIHEYQEACIDKLERFIVGDVSKPVADIIAKANGAMSPKLLADATRSPLHMTIGSRPGSKLSLASENPVYEFDPSDRSTWYKKPTPEFLALIKNSTVSQSFESGNKEFKEIAEISNRLARFHPSRVSTIQYGPIPIDVSKSQSLLPTQEDIQKRFKIDLRKSVLDRDHSEQELDGGDQTGEWSPRSTRSTSPYLPLPPLPVTLLLFLS